MVVRAEPRLNPSGSEERERVEETHYSSALCLLSGDVVRPPAESAKKGRPSSDATLWPSTF